MTEPHPRPPRRGGLGSGGETSILARPGRPARLAGGEVIKRIVQHIGAGQEQAGVDLGHRLAPVDRLLGLAQDGAGIDLCVLDAVQGGAAAGPPLDQRPEDGTGPAQGRQQGGVDVEGPQSRHGDGRRLQDLVEIHHQQGIGRVGAQPVEGGRCVDIASLDDDSAMTPGQRRQGLERRPAAQAEEQPCRLADRPRHDLGRDQVEAQPEGHPHAGLAHTGRQLGKEAAMVGIETARYQYHPDALAMGLEQAIEGRQAGQAFEMTEGDALHTFCNGLIFHVFFAGPGNIFAVSGFYCAVQQLQDFATFSMVNASPRLN